MPDPAVIGLVGTDLRDHPAVRAWRGLRPDHVEPVAIEIIKGRPPARLHGKSFVGRLVGAGPSGAPVIAKRCRLDKAALEHAVYAGILSRLPVSALRCHGLVPERDGPCGWLFLEDAGGDPCDPDAPAHRVLVARWLGRLHTSASGVKADLPDRGPAHFLAHLESGRAGLRRCMGNPALGTDDVAVLAEIDSMCAAIESRWTRVERACAGMPRTLVHGDLKPANIRIRHAPGEPRLLPMDWETAGWGPPAVDLPAVDPERYQAAVGPAWPDLDLPRARRWAGTGVLFRHLAAIDWETERLALEWVRRPMRRMRGFARGLAGCLRALDDEE